MPSESNNLSVTIVVPVYNVEKYLHRCIDSLLAQDKTPSEIILVDDGATDSSGKICDEYARKFDHIRAIHKPNGGLSSARKAGWQQANGDLIAFIDSDDTIEPSYIRKLSAAFEDEETDLAICSYHTIHEGVKTPHQFSCGREISNSSIAHDYILPTIGAIEDEKSIDFPGFVPIRMYKRNLLEASDFLSEREYFTEDILLNLLYSKKITGKIRIVNEPLYDYYVNPGSLTQKYRENAFGMLYACYLKCKELTEEFDHLMHAERKRRLDSNLRSAMTYGIYNIGTLAKYSEFKKELKKILSNPDVRELLRQGIRENASNWHKIIYLTCRLRAYYLLYKLLKTRKTI